MAIWLLAQLLIDGQESNWANAHVMSFVCKLALRDLNWEVCLVYPRGFLSGG